MANIVGDIAVSVGADTSDFERGMRRAQGRLGSFDKSAAQMAKNIAKVGVAVGAVGVAAVAGGYRIAQSAAATAKEIENLSSLAGVSAERFQKYAAAADKVGIGQEKLADIFKDVNDKVGDFIANGAGPLQDFFDNIAPQVGVTADQFARLSGPEALQLYVSSLEQAGVSQQQMTFYMEAIASDATALIPLLRDGGSEMRRLGDEAERSGRILSNDMVRGGAELDRKMADLSATISRKFTAAVLDNAEEISALVDVFSDELIPALIAVGTFVGGVATKVGEMAGAIGSAAESVGTFYEQASKFAQGKGMTAHAIWGDDESKWPAWLQSLRGTAASPTPPMVTTGTGLNAGDDLLPPTMLPEVVFPSGSASPGSPLAPSSSLRPRLPSVDFGSDPAGGGGGRNIAEDFQRFQQSLMTQAEMVEQWRSEQLEKLAEYREARVGTEELYNEAERRIEEEHQKALSEINRRAMDERLYAIGGALGDVATLMQTENDKLFRIGQAAAVAQAVVDGWSAATAAWAKGMQVGGPPVAAAFTAASLARTGAMIASISSASPRGTGGGGPGGGGGATGAVSAAAPLNVYLPQIEPQGMYSGSTISSLFEQLQKEAGDRGLKMVFAS